MERKSGYKFVIFFIILGMFLINNSALAISATTIEIIPEKPEPKSEIEIIATVDMEGVEETYIQIQECDINTGICYERKNISLSKVDDNTYKTSYNLKESKATYIQYDLIVKTGLGWENLIKEKKTDLLISQNNGNGGNGNQDTPGFEILGIFLGILVIILLFKRKR